MQKTKQYILLLLLCFLAAAPAFAYTVEEVPNIHQTDKNRYVSNPDNILSATTVSQMDAIIGNVWEKTTAELAVVAISKIDGSSDIETFATELYRHWGIGKEDKNNGVLILLVTEERRVVIRTGYGTEGLLPDIYCSRIIRNLMLPQFKKGDYDSGMLAAVSEIGKLLTTPGAVEELKSKYANNARRNSDGGMFSMYGNIAIIIGIGALVWVLMLLAKTSKSDPAERHMLLSNKKLTLGMLTIFSLGCALPAFLILLWSIKRCRTKPRICPNCKATMRKLPEDEDNRYLTPAQDLEEQLQSVDYDVWVCDRCNEVDIFPFVNKNTVYSECPHCHTKAAMLVSDRILQKASFRSEGIGVRTYKCRNCNHTTDLRYSIPREEAPVIVPFIGGGGGGGGFSGGGSFGGGSTGGGGASGGW